MTNTSPVSAITRRWWIVVLFAVIGALLGALPQPAQVEEQATSFTATHTLIANEGGDTAIVSPSQVTLFATAGEVPIRAAARIGYSGSPAELASQVQATFDFESSALTITTTQELGDRAEDVANAFADELVAYLGERQDRVYADRLEASRSRLEELQAELNRLTGELGVTPTDPILLAQRDAISRQYALAFEQNDVLEQSPEVLTFTTLERAQAVPVVDRGLSAPTSRTTRAAMGFAVGTAIGLAVAIVLGRLDRKIRSREQAEELVSMRARVTIPRVRGTVGGVVVSAGRHDPLSDAYRTVRNVVGFVQSGQGDMNRARITLIVSPGPGDGKTALSANLAAAFLELGQRTIAVNTDFRRPRLHKAIMGTPPPEIPFALRELDDVPRRALPLDTTSDNMKILDLSSVLGSPGELVRASMRQIERLSEVADQIVIDTSPVGSTAEVLDLVPLADVIVLVTRVGHTSITATDRTISILRDIADAPIVFVVGGVKAERNPYNEYSGHRAARPESSPGGLPEPSEPALQ